GAVAADRKTDVYVELDGGVQLELGSRSEPMLSRLLGIEPQLGACSARDSPQLLEGRRGLGGPAVGEHRGGAHGAHGSTSAAAASRSSTPPPGPSASQMNVS